MANVFVFLTDGFEEIEALATVDVLRRAQLAVQTVSLTGQLQVTGGHQVTVQADVLFEQADFSAAQMLVVPGGTVKYAEHEGLKQRLLDFARQGGKVAAICASPALLGSLGLLQDKNATCYPGFEQHLTGARLQAGQAVVVDGLITTGRGPGLTLDFALALVEQLAGPARRGEVAQALLLAH